jgi:hypothetical protein
MPLKIVWRNPLLLIRTKRTLLRMRRDQFTASANLGEIRQFGLSPIAIISAAYHWRVDCYHSSVRARTRVSATRTPAGAVYAVTAPDLPQQVFDIDIGRSCLNSDV